MNAPKPVIPFLPRVQAVGQAIVILNGGDFRVELHVTRASMLEYDRLLAECAGEDEGMKMSQVALVHLATGCAGCAVPRHESCCYCREPKRTGRSAEAGRPGS